MASMDADTPQTGTIDRSTSKKQISYEDEPGEDSESSYENFSENEEGESDNDDDSVLHGQFSERLSTRSLSRSEVAIPYSDEQIRHDAARWAAEFVPSEGNLESYFQRRSRSVSRSSAGRSTKRKAESVAGKSSKVKRAKGLYSNEYRKLLNFEIHHLQLPAYQVNHDPLYGSQIGVSMWSSDEKESFFVALARLGKENLPGISAAVNTKSVLEVQEYIQLLHQGMIEKIANEPRQQMLSLTDLPAATQISAECCELLDGSAEALSSYQDRYEAQEEKNRWGEEWLLTPMVNEKLEQVEEGSENYDKLSKMGLISAIELFNLEKWLALSTDIFMNSSSAREGGNWRDLIEPGEEHGIRAKAFSDFHLLAISITKKLMSTTLFVTMSRLRATSKKSFRRIDMVRRKDVKAAAKIIGLKVDSKEFWRTSARRCGLNVYRTLSEKIPMEYDEVEYILGQSKSVSYKDSLPSSPNPASSQVSSDSESLGEQSNNSSDGETDQQPDSEESVVGHDDVHEAVSRGLASEYMNNATFDYEGAINPSDSEFANPNTHAKALLDKARANILLQRAQSRYAEAFDVKAGLIEEERLWKLLKMEPPFTIKPEDFELPDHPDQDRKQVQDIADWRDSTKFWSDWEMFSKPVSTAAFIANSKCSTTHTEPRTTDDADHNSASVCNEYFDGHVLNDHAMEEKLGEDIELDVESEMLTDIDSPLDDQRSPSDRSTPSSFYRERRMSTVSLEPPDLTDAMLQRIQEMEFGDLIIPPCDRCRRHQLDCVRGIGACVSCAGRKKQCAWAKATEEELDEMSVIDEKVLGDHTGLQLDQSETRDLSDGQLE